MDALVSGVAAKIVFLSGGEATLTYVEADRPEERLQVDRGALSFLLADVHDVELLRDVSETQCFGNCSPLPL